MTSHHRIPGALASLLLLGLSVSACGGDDTSTAAAPAKAPPAATERVMPEGEYYATVDIPDEGNRKLELWLKPDSIRMTAVDDGEPWGGPMGFTTFDGDKLELVLDPERMQANDWGHKSCFAKTAIGSYRLERAQGGVRFNVDEDPCELRREVLTAAVWKP